MVQKQDTLHLKRTVRRSGARGWLCARIQRQFKEELHQIILDSRLEGCSPYGGGGGGSVQTAVLIRSEGYLLHQEGCVMEPDRNMSAVDGAAICQIRATGTEVYLSIQPIHLGGGGGGCSQLIDYITY